MSEEREAIEQQYLKENGGLPETSEEAKETKETKEEPKPEDTPKTEQPPVEAEKPEIAEEKKEPVKTEEETRKEQEKENNLKKALDEERAKRKQLRDEKAALEARLRQFEEAHKPKPEEAEPEILDYDAELKSLRKTVKSIELLEAKREELARQESIIQEHRKQQETLQNMVKTVDKKLADEGYAGFEEMAGRVTAELIEMARDDPEEAKELDNPQGWEKIFKERVYPTFQKKYEESTRKRVIEDKKALKKEANLTTSTSKAPQKKEDDDPNTWSEERTRQEYLKERQARLA